MVQQYGSCVISSVLTRATVNSVETLKARSFQCDQFCSYSCYCELCCDTEGTLISVRHSFVIQGKTGSCMTDPSTTAPVFVLPLTGNDPSGPASQPAAPPPITSQPGFEGAWNPGTVAPVFAIPMARCSFSETGGLSPHFFALDFQQPLLSHTLPCIYF